MALIATLTLVWLGEAGDNNPADAEIVEPVQRAARRDAGEADSATGRSDHNPAVRKNPVAQVPAGISPPPRFPIGGADLFPAQSWLPPPPPVPQIVEAPPPPPQAPELPFDYIGRWAAAEGKDGDNGAGESVFLTQGEQVVILQVGQSRASWRLDTINAQGLLFTYLPLQQQRQLRYAP